MKKIIYATDFSENSVAALKYSYQLGKLLKADVIVLHIFNPDDLSTARTIAEKKQVIEHHTSRLEKFCSLNLQENFNNLDLSLAVIKGENISREIIKFVRDIDVLMLVLGACGSGTVRDFLPGSTTKNVISSSPYPVITVPGNFNFTKLKKVMYATDLEEEDLYNLCEFVRVFGPLEVEITVVHVTSNKETEANDLMEWFKELLFEKTSYSHFNFQILYSTDIIEALTGYYIEVEADLVIMMEHKTTFAIHSVLHRDLVKRMQSCTKIPLLSLKEIH